MQIIILKEIVIANKEIENQKLPELIEDRPNEIENQLLGNNINETFNLKTNLSSLQFKVVPNFDGSKDPESLERFIDLAEKAINSYDDVNEKKKIFQAILGKLHGRAYTVGKNTTNIGELKEKLRQNFFPNATMEEIEFKVDHLGFKPDESIEEYVLRAENLQIQYSEILTAIEGVNIESANAISNEKIRRHFIKGLDDPIRSILNSHAAKDFKSTADSAIRQVHLQRIQGSDVYAAPQHPHHPQHPQYSQMYIPYPYQNQLYAQPHQMYSSYQPMPFPTNPNTLPYVPFPYNNQQQFAWREPTKVKPTTNNNVVFQQPSPNNYRSCSGVITDDLVNGLENLSINKSKNSRSGNLHPPMGQH